MNYAILLSLYLISIVQAAELIVFTSTAEDDGDRLWKDRTTYTSLMYADGSYVSKPPKESVVQEGQLYKEVYSNLKPGKYRAILNSVQPFGFSEAIMETHIRINKDDSKVVILIPQKSEEIKIPKEIEIALKKFADASMMDLLVSCPGFEKKYYQVRALKCNLKYRDWIHYLRPDCEYTITFWSKDAPIKSLYSKTFKVLKSNKSNK